jgi:hypothetical protein
LFLQWQRACNEVELRPRAQKVRIEMKWFEQLSVLAAWVCRRKRLIAVGSAGRPLIVFCSVVRFTQSMPGAWPSKHRAVFGVLS